MYWYKVILPPYALYLHITKSLTKHYLSFRSISFRFQDSIRNNQINPKNGSGLVLSVTRRTLVRPTAKNHWPFTNSAFSFKRG